MKILIIRAGALGDTLMLMPAIRGLGDRAGITVAGRRPGIDYLMPHVDRCIDMETSGWHRIFMDEIDRPLISIPEPDQVSAFLNDPDGRLRDRLRSIFPGAAVSTWPVFPPEGYRGHIALYMSEAMQDAGLPMDSNRAFQTSLEYPILRPDAPVPGEEGPVIIHPGSGSKTKNYPPSFWISLIHEIRDIKQDKRIQILIGPAEEDILPVFREGLTEGDVEIKVIPEREALMSILLAGSVYIGHDSGITHLAAMMGLHVIALFKHTSVEQWRPLGPNVRILKNGDYIL